MENKYFTNNLEQDARSLISGTKRDVPGDIASQLEQKIELILEQLRNLREQESDKNHLNNFSQSERSVGTELMQMNQYTPQYVNHSTYSYNRQPSCNEAQQRPYVMEVKQRIEPVVHKDQVQRLQQKLFSLLEKHKQSSVQKTRKYWTGIMTEPTSGLLM